MCRLRNKAALPVLLTECYGNGNILGVCHDGVTRDHPNTAGTSISRAVHSSECPAHSCKPGTFIMQCAALLNKHGTSDRATPSSEVLGTRGRVVWRIFASSTSCRERRDLGVLGPGSVDWSTSGDGAGGDSGGGGGSKGKSDSSAEAKQGSMVVPRSGKQPVRPYKAKKSSMGPPTDAVEFDGTRVSGARPKKAGSNVESTPSETSCMGNKLPAVWLLRPEKPIGTLKFQSRPPRKLNAGSNSKKGTYENFPQQPGDDGPINGLLYNPIQGPITVAEAFEELLNRLWEYIGGRE
ncbi:hypothetical protein B0H10DRAFT_1964263 [Mycena sp. CBHHK59/15]|nr:hypothetical protein B0H10DRAFT_1964263 [Mycena sp. CBHHK59/15]